MKKKRHWNQFSIISILCLCVIILWSMPEWKNKKIAVAKTESNMNVLDDGGSTIEAQDYEAWTKPITSHLVPVQNGFMGIRFISKEDSGKNGRIVVSYYDNSFHITDRKVIAEELPIWGGFGASSDAYYLVTGQKNEEESDSKEVIRVTKYDKNWNRMGSAGAKGCNVYEPFQFATVRMDFYKQYLVIKTGRLIYETEDGVHHQVQLTLEVNTDNMRMIESGADYGYVSHSLNQFIKIEDEKVISVEQGDCFPRGIILFESDNLLNEKASQNKLEESGNVKSTTLLEVPDNDDFYQNLRASIGALEISDSHYLVAGNSVIQDEQRAKRTTRNIFILAKNKTTDEVQTNWITSYQEGDGTVTTPHMVKLSDEKFMVLWSREDAVYYTLVDSEGKQVSEIYQHEGHLSDCKPILKNGNIYWYTVDDLSMDFYTIFTTDLSVFAVKKTDNGHQYTLKTVDSGIASLACSKCDHIERMKVATSFNTWHNEKGPEEEYCGGPDGTLKLNKGEKVYFWTTFEQEDINTEMNIIVEKNEVASYTATSDDTGYFTALADGTTKVTVALKWNPDLKREFQLKVGQGEKEPSESGNIVTGGTGSTKAKYKVNSSKAVTYYKTLVSSGETTAKVPESVKLQGKSYKVSAVAAKAFQNNKKLKKISIGKNVVKIKARAFYGCKKLESIKFNTKKLEEIGDHAFYGCKNLKKFTLKSKKLKKKGVKNSLKGSSLQTINTTSSLQIKYKKYFSSKNAGRKVKVRKS